MTEINTSLRTMTFSNGQTAKLHKDTEAMRINDSKNALTLTLGNSDNAVQTKEFKNGKIYRFHSTPEHNYSSAVPKNGSGNFWILDNYSVIDSNLGEDKVSIGGKVRNGKITELNAGKLTSDTPLTLDKIKKILAKSEAKEISLQNLTKVYLNKALKFLKK